MGMSVSATLAFGIASTDDVDIRELIQSKFGEEVDYDTILRSHLGFPEYPETSREDQDNWRLLLRKWEKENPEINLSGNDGYLNYNIIMPQSKNKVYLHEVEHIKNLNINPEWIGQIKSACEILGVPYSEPRWFLTVLYF